MYAIAPGAGGGNWCTAYARRARTAASAGGVPLSSQSTLASISGRTVRAAGGLKQIGDRTRGFQKPGSFMKAESFTLPEKERRTRQAKPFVPCAASTNPVR